MGNCVPATSPKSQKVAPTTIKHYTTVPFPGYRESSFPRVEPEFCYDPNDYRIRHEPIGSIDTELQ